MKTATPLDRLAILATQRTARTDRLHEATTALLSQLEAHVNASDSVTVDGYKLSLCHVRSNVGANDFWIFSSPGGENDWNGSGTSCYLEKPVNGEGYMHGDFNCAWVGPTREDLLAFASRAERFVGGFVVKFEATIQAIEDAEAAISAARELVQS